jgi:hypothetical protein
MNYGHLLAHTPANPGDHYKVRARQHLADSASDECTNQS